ncbi:MAG: potassium transporter TrkH, partial [Alphaproteobacteria bacterium HGW-Alphaproteobacteria-2]
MIVAWLVLAQRQPFEPALREALFNAVSLFSGTGYGSVDVTAWGPFPFVVLFTIGLIGGCTSSTACSVKVFRYQVLFAAIRAQLRRIHAPSGVFPVRYEGRTLGEDVISAVMVFFTLFFLSFTLLTLALALTGLQTRTAITAAWAAIANIGPAFGPEVGPTGAVDGFPLTAKWLMIAGMLVGRLELISVYVLFTVRFWRA